MYLCMYGWLLLLFVYIKFVSWLIKISSQFSSHLIIIIIIIIRRSTHTNCAHKQYPKIGRVIFFLLGSVYLSVCPSLLLNPSFSLYLRVVSRTVGQSKSKSKQASEWVRERTRAFSILQHNPFVYLRICVNWFVFYSPSEKKRSQARLRSVHIRQRDVINMGDTLRGNHSSQSFDPFFSRLD